MTLEDRPGAPPTWVPTALMADLRVPGHSDAHLEALRVPVSGIYPAGG